MGDLNSGFSMPGNDFFYLSSMYSDKLLVEFLPKVKNRAYQRYLQIQKDILNGNEITGMMKYSSTAKYYFKESIELNEEFGFPLGSIYCDITEQGFHLDIGDKLKFIRKFKNFNTPISSTDIIANPDIFTYAIRFMIGDYAFNKFYLMKDKYQRMYIGIKNNSLDGLSSAAMNRLFGTTNVAFCMWKDNPSVAYTYTGTFNDILFNSTTSGMKRINIPKSNAMNNLYPLNENNWTICITSDGTRYGNYIYKATNINLVSENNTTLVFDIPIPFVNDITSRNINVSIAVIQRPNRKAIYAYNPSNDTVPMLTLGDTNRPVSIANIKMYAYDMTTGAYKRRIPFESNNFGKEFNDKVKIESYDETKYTHNDTINSIFPSIFNFTNITEPIRIELIDFVPSISNTTFDNNLVPLFNNPKDKSVSAENYLNYLSWLTINEYNSLRNLLYKFNPINIYMDYTDFMKSGMKLREYKFNKLMQLIASDPYIYAEYIKFMDHENFNIIRESGSPKYFKFNTGITSDNDLTGTNSVVMDDAFTCVNKNDEVFTFTEPHSFIKVHSENPDAYCMVFVGGRMISPTRVKSKLNDIYIFIPQSTMKKYIEEAIAKMNDDTSGMHVKDNMITVEIYSKINRSTSNQIHYSTTFDATTISKKIFDGDENFKFKLADLVIYNKITGEYIPLSKFDITAILKRATIEFDDGTTDKVIGAIKDIIYMGTNAGEFYMTQDNVKIILEEDTEDYDFPKDDSVSGNRKDNYSNFQNKEWAASDLKFKINDPKLAGTEIEFVYSPVSYAWDIPFNRFTKDETSGKYTYSLGGFITRKDLKLFDLYINGEYLEPDNYITLPNGVSIDDRIVITFNGIPNKLWYSSDDNPIIQLRYNPTTYNREYGTAYYIPSEYAEDYNTFKTYYDPFNPIFITMYECLDANHYMNSDNSRVYIRKSTDNPANSDRVEDPNETLTTLSVPYTWMNKKSKTDMQDLSKVSIYHPVLINIHQFNNYYPILVDLNRDLSFINNSHDENSRSAMDTVISNSMTN